MKKCQKYKIFKNRKIVLIIQKKGLKKEQKAKNINQQSKEEPKSKNVPKISKEL